ncbi:MAG: hypothetical protein ACLQVI_00165 [Polyangiaceae bacterium]
MPKVRGSAILTRVRYVKEKFGDEGWKRLEPTLSALSKQVLSGPVENRTWHPFETFIDLNVRIDALFGRGDNRLCYDIGAYGADKNLTTLYRVFFRLGSVSFIMGKAAALWSEHYDSGKLLSASDESKALTLTLEDFATPHCAHCFSVMGWAARSIELTGASLVGKQRTACRYWRDKACVMAFRTA